jgi:hypothetical protein
MTRARSSPLWRSSQRGIGTLIGGAGRQEAAGIAPIPGVEHILGMLRTIIRRPVEHPLPG